jgi:hypothetical protein
MKHDFDWQPMREEYRRITVPPQLKDQVFGTLSDPRKSLAHRLGFHRPLPWVSALAIAVLIAFGWSWIAGDQHSRPTEVSTLSDTRQATSSAIAVSTAPSKIEQVASPAAPVMRQPTKSARNLREAKIRFAKLRRPSLDRRQDFNTYRSQPEERVTEFVAFPGAEALPAMEATLIRATVPQEQMRRLGFRFASPNDGYVRADFAVGPDGLARAVRLVQ